VRLVDTEGGDIGTAGMWAEDLRLSGAEAVAVYRDGPLPGVAAVTRHGYGTGLAWYVATRTEPATTAAVVERVLADAGVRGTGLPAGVECVRRVGADRSYLFVLNHRAESVVVPAAGVDLVTGRAVDGSLELAAGGVACVRERRD
ncbi:MAG: beta-galactosidase trimerization domain-containing protein, partial [Geodermatophilaceae bacterium]|nr:beta-galactosidase trimerization domain-containing protein [Geodermatophilaceae bacterium]